MRLAGVETRRCVRPADEATSGGSKSYRPRPSVRRGGRRREGADGVNAGGVLSPLRGKRGKGECCLSRTCGTMAETKSLPEGLYAGRKLTEEAF